MKKILIVCISLIFLNACTVEEHDTYLPSNTGASISYRHKIDFFARDLANQLVSSQSNMSEYRAIAVTSFVDLNNINKTNWLGNAVSEGVMGELQKFGYTVADYKMTGAIKVTKEGDFALSRNYKDLMGAANIDYILVGTMFKQIDGVFFNARIVNTSNNIVVASGQGFMPTKSIGMEYTSENVRIDDADKAKRKHEKYLSTHAVKLKDGSISREAVKDESDKPRGLLFGLPAY